MKTFTFVWTTLALGILVMAGLWFRPVTPPLPASPARKGKASAGASAPAARTNAAALTTRLPGETLLQAL